MGVLNPVARAEIVTGVGPPAAAVPEFTSTDMAVVELACGAITDEGEKLQLAPAGNPEQESAIVPTNSPFVVRLKFTGELGFPCATFNGAPDRGPKVKSITRIVSTCTCGVVPGSLPVA